MKPRTKVVSKFTVIEKPPPQAPVKKVEKKEVPPIKTNKKVTKKKVRAVYGLKKKSLKGPTKQTDGVKVKSGNTLAKTPDKKILKAGEENLPTPSEEYLVTEFPVLESEIIIDYPPEARKKGIEGTVVFQLLIDASGKVRKAEVLNGPGFGLTKAAFAAIYRFRFKPAKVGEKPVAVSIRYGYKFVLER